MKHFLTLNSILLFLSLLISIPSFGKSGKIYPVSLRCENMDNPKTIDEIYPRLSWINQAVSESVRGEYQTAYRIQVASSKINLLKGKGDIWDSGKTKSSESCLIPYSGQKALESGKDYWWRVMTWDKSGKSSGWSEAANWGMGLLKPEEWKAQWIGAPWQGEKARMTKGEAAPAEGYPSYPAPMFRKNFSTQKEVSSAKVFVTGLGYFELYLNNKKVGNDCLVPNITNYSVRDDLKKAGLAINNDFKGYRVLYLAYDVSEQINKGNNTLGALVGDGFYDCTSHWVSAFGSPRLLCQLMITYTDGTKEMVCSDNSWKVKASPILMNGIYDGEIYDARSEIKEWCDPSCDETDWENVVIRNAPTGKLCAHSSPTDKVVERIKPISLIKNADGTYEADFGVEISGWLKLDGIKGSKGDTVDVKYICESPLGIQKYICNGNDNESYAPRFTWYVFRKVVISGIDNITEDMLTAEAVNTDVNISAEFRTSNPLLNQINKIWQRSQLDNMHGSVASDCPHRERSAYTGDGQVACVTVMHNFDAAAFYNKWIRDIRDAQSESSGYVPNGAPWQPGCGGGVAWGAAMNIMPWEYYLHYGDKKMLSDNYDAMKQQVEYMLKWQTSQGTMLQQRSNFGSTEPNYWFNLGDWAPAFEIPSEELVHTFYLWRCLDFTAKAAKALGNEEDNKHYLELASKVNNAFHKKFYNRYTKTYGDYGSNIFALVMGVPQGDYPDVVNTVRKEISETYKGHLNTGIFGTQFFFETLAANGMNDIAYEAMNKKDFPSFGNWIEQGATTTWEQWNGKDSRNHPMFGGGLNWFYRTLAGVNVDEQEPGYRHIIIKPQIPEELDEVFYSNITPYGKVISEIKRNRTGMIMNVTVPVGSYATLYFPFGKQTVIKEREQSILAGPDNIKVLPSNEDIQIVRLNQGNYSFTIEK